MEVIYFFLSGVMEVILKSINKIQVFNSNQKIFLMCAHKLQTTVYSIELFAQCMYKLCSSHTQAS